MMRKSYLRFLLLFLLPFLLLLSCEKDLDEVYEDYLRHISVMESMDFYYYCNVDITQPGNTGQYKNLLIYMHGAGLDASNHFDSATKAVNSAGLSDNTVVLAPQYQKSNTRNNYYWTKYSWKDGRKSINAVPKISSYAILDTLLINNILKVYNDIETVVVSGHSAGAQFVYRYSVLSKFPDLVSQEVHYLPLNPSSVTYLGPERWNADKERFEVPLNGPSCSNYDKWTYGVSDLSSNEYDKEITKEEIITIFPSRYLTIGIGTLDLEGQGGGDGCEDLYQGEHRYARAHNVHNHLDLYYPENSHEIIDVEGVDHSSNRMIVSPEIISFLREVFE